MGRGRPGWQVLTITNSVTWCICISCEFEGFQIVRHTDNNEVSLCEQNFKQYELSLNVKICQRLQNFQDGQAE